MALKYAPGLHSHLGGVVLVWHKKSKMLFLTVSKTTTTPSPSQYNVFLQQQQQQQWMS